MAERQDGDHVKFPHRGDDIRSKSLPWGHHVRSKSLPWGQRSRSKSRGQPDPPPLGLNIDRCITIDVSAIRHVVIFQASFGHAYLQCVKYFLLANKFISVFSLQKSSFERAEQLSLSFSWRENL